MLRNVKDHEEKAITIDHIQKFVSDYYQLKLADLKSRNNSKSIAMPRQIAMYLCKNLTHASLPEIGRSFGGKHHSTVIHSIRKVEALRKKTAVQHASQQLCREFTVINAFSTDLPREGLHRPVRQKYLGRKPPHRQEGRSTVYPQENAQFKYL